MKRDIIAPSLLPHVLAARSRFARVLMRVRREFGRYAARQYLKMITEAQARVLYGAEQDILENRK